MPSLLASQQTSPDARQSDDPFADVHAFCLFVGYSRSGHSLVGALLDAHPEITIAHEANVLRLVVDEGFSREALLEKLVENARRQTEHPKGRHASGGYSYVVPGQWQGRTRHLRVIGDKCGGRTRGRLEQDPTELAALERTVQLPLRLVHVVRNPYDNIARWVRVSKNGMTVAGSVERFAQTAGTIDSLIAAGEPPVLTVRHEALIDSPRTEIASLCNFLGVETDDSYLDACASIVFDSPHATRHRVEWTPAEIEGVQEIIDRHAFLAGYGWTST